MREESLVINHGAEGSERGKVETEGRKEGGSKRVRSLTSFDTLSEKHSAKLHARADLQWHATAALCRSLGGRTFGRC